MFSLKIMRLSEFSLNFFQKWSSVRRLSTLLAKTLLLVHTLKLIDILLTSKSLYNPKLLHFDKQFIWLCHKGLNFISLTRWHFKVNVRRLNISTNFPAKYFQVFQSCKFCSYEITAGFNWMTLKYSEMPRNAFHIFNLIGTAMMGFLTGESWCILKSWCKGGKPEQGFQCCFADGLKQMFTFLLWRRLRLSLRTKCFSLWFSLPIAEPFSPGNFEEIVLLKFHKSTETALLQRELLSFISLQTKVQIFTFRFFSV